MQKIKLFLFPQRFWPLAVLSAALLISGCTKDPMAGASVSSEPTISFEVSGTDGWYSLPQSRAAADAAQGSAPYSMGVLTLQGDTPADTLFLHASVSEGMDGTGFVNPESATRAAPVTEDAFYESFGVLASIFDGSWDESSCTPEFMYNVEVSASSFWTTSYYWPGDGRKLRFFAYAPYNGSGIVLSDKTAVGTPEITYTVPSAVEDQKDLCVAVTGELSGNGSSPVSLTFAHALTSVRFTTGTQMLAGEIKSITLKDVYGRATLSMGGDSWTGHTSVSSFSQTVNVGLDGSAGQTITSDAATFMMLPQTLPDGAQIEIVYTDSLTSTQRTLTASIGGSSWPAGKTVTYKISTTSIEYTPVFNVEFSSTSFSYAGGDGSYSVTSYASVSRAGDETVTVPLGWVAEFSTDGGVTWTENRPDWLTDFTAEDSGGSVGGTEYGIGVSGQAGIVAEDSHTQSLRNTANINTGSGRNPYNLSNANGAEEVERTANSYVINAPGTYSLPLVYGNAIDKSVNPVSPYYNTNAYSSATSGENVLQAFVNHAGVAITDPYIYDNANCTPASVRLIWQDTYNLVSDIRLSDDGHHLIFTVDQGTIAQGNAVVAVCNASGQVLWSWHIWVTDYILGDGLRTFGTSSMLPYNLGWCDPQAMSYAARSVQVRFTQNETGEQRVITVNQTAHDVSYLGNNPYYQWGRKDPMLPSTGTDDNANKIWCDNSGLSSTTWNAASFGTGSATLANAILNPGTYCSNVYMDNLYFNLWAANNNSTSLDLTSSVKTVYDPCPVGYKVPLPGALAFSTDSGTWGTRENTNGWYFNCTEGTVFFPAAGRRVYSSGKLDDVGSNGHSWTAVPGSTESSHVLFFTSAIVQIDSYVRGTAYPVRPVKE